MSFSTQPAALNYKSKHDLAVTTSATGSVAIGQLSGPVQIRHANYNTARVAFLYGAKADADAITVATAPTLGPGVHEIITVYPNSDGSPVWLNVIGDTGASGGGYEYAIAAGN
jgi:hypothetical protein